MMPKQNEMEIPLLAVLSQLGGKAPAQSVYSAITKLFPQLTESDVAEPLPSGGNKWTNRIQWVRQSLVARGELASAGHGIWAITDKGQHRLTADSPNSVAVSFSENLPSNGRPAPQPISQTPAHPPTPVPVSPSPSDMQVNLEELADDYEHSFKQKVLNKLQDLTPLQFEQFAGHLLRAFGFHKVAVTGKSGDGGIDGHGQLKVGLATVKAAFQCKRWQNTVSPKEVQAFRGAIQGQFEQGYFFTTSTFSKAAQTESIKSGAVSVILFDGEQIVEIMIEKGIGVRRRPIETYEDQLEQLFDPEK